MSASPRGLKFLNPSGKDIRPEYNDRLRAFVLRWWDEVKNTERGKDYIIFRGSEHAALNKLLALKKRWEENVDLPTGIELEGGSIEQDLIMILDREHSKEVHH